MLEIRNITSGYNKKTVLDGLSLTLSGGELTSVIGPNGCGKSTLLKTVSGLIPHTNGQILIDGVPLNTLNKKETATKISYLAQEKNCPDMTVEQLVLHGRFSRLGFPFAYSDTDRVAAEKAMDRLGILSLAESPLSSLSGGTRQKAYVAMALAQDTDYILLDEPAAYLDISAQLELMRLLKELAASGKGIIAVMHDLPLAFSFSDKILVMSDGSAAAVGSSEELCSSDTLQKIFGVSLTCDSQTYKYVY